jgi:hypothetical protein
MRRVLFLCLLLITLAACDNSANTAGSGGGDPIQWDRSPSAIVFRAEVRGGEYEGTFLSRNEIPLCTIYGDNRVVWTSEGGGVNQVLYDQVTDERIREFVNYLAVVETIYQYTAGADDLPPASVSPVVETLTLHVNDVEHRTDAFGGWNIDYFERILRACRSISNAPVVFEPEGGWVSAEAVAYSSEAISSAWDANAAGLSFAELATSGTPRWITGDLVRIVWNALRQSPFDSRFREGDSQYRVALQVPNVTYNSPPPP